MDTTNNNQDDLLNLLKPKKSIKQVLKEKEKEKKAKNLAKNGNKQKPKPLKPSIISTKNKSAYNKIQYEKEKDKTSLEFASIYKLKTFGRFACDRRVSIYLFTSRSLAKPKWAIEALIKLRDANKCQICESYIYKKPYIKNVFPRSEKIPLSEISGILVCSECNKCWTQKNFFLPNKSFEEGFRKLRIFILKRRLNKYKNSKPLTNRENFVLSNLLFEERRLDKNER